MAYTTSTDIEQAAGGRERLVQLADWNRTGEPDAAAVAAAQADADGLIDSYASRRYAVPLANPSPFLVRLAAKETVYQLLVARQMATEQDREQHDERVQWLEALAGGRVRPSEPLPSRSSAVRDRYRGSERAVSRDRMKGFW